MASTRTRPQAAARKARPIMEPPRKKRESSGVRVRVNRLDSRRMRKSPMTPEEIGSRRDEIAGSRGPWRQDNLRLAKDVYTMEPGARGRDGRVRAVAQWIADVVGAPMKG